MHIIGDKMLLKKYVLDYFSIMTAETKNVNTFQALFSFVGFPASLSAWTRSINDFILSINISISFLVYEMSENVDQCFPKSKMTSSN